MLIQKTFLLSANNFLARFSEYEYKNTSNQIHKYLVWNQMQIAFVVLQEFDGKYIRLDFYYLLKVY